MDAARGELKAPSGQSLGKVRLGTLLLLRWFAMAGQTITVLFVYFGMGFEIPLGPVLTVIAASGWLNIFLMVTRRSLGAVSEREAAFHLGYDVLQLGALLFFTGGSENPFLLLFIAPVAVAASVLRPKVTAILAGLATACILILTLWHWPLPWAKGETLSLPMLYQFGLTAACLIGLAFTSIYAWRVAAEEERLNAALAAVQVVLSREQRLAALGGLAAAAAHELGTPLATIHLVAKEMQRGLAANSPLKEDVDLLVSQSERCRHILKQLSARKEEGDAVLARVPLTALLDEIVEPFRLTAPHIRFQIHADQGPPPEIRRLPEVHHGVGNLVENAVSFAATQVAIHAIWSADHIEVRIEDDGPGFPAAVLIRLGEPYITERSSLSAGGGLGLGFFIAKTLLERSGGRIRFHNRIGGEATGAVVHISWPRGAIEASAPN